MQVSPFHNPNVVSLFEQPKLDPLESAAPLAPPAASVFSRASGVGQPEVYSDPAKASRVGPVFSERTKLFFDFLAAVQSNEGKALQENIQILRSAIETRDEMVRNGAPEFLPRRATNDLPRDLIRDVLAAGRADGDFSKVPKEALNGVDSRTLNSALKQADHTQAMFQLRANLAQNFGLNGPVRSFLIGDQFFDMNKEELATYTIESMVESRVNLLKQGLQQLQSERFSFYTQGAETPSGAPEVMTEEDIATIRADLLEQTWDRYRKGQFDVQVTVFASKHAANYEKSMKEVDLLSGQEINRPENAVEFDPDWTFSPKKAESMARTLKVMTSPEVTHMLEKMGRGPAFGAYQEEYMRDAGIRLSD